MQVSRRQAALALDAVRRRHRRAKNRHHHPVRRGPVARPSPVVIDLAFDHVEGMGPVRIELVEAVNARRALGQWPTADEVADMAIRRAVCDHLR